MPFPASLHAPAGPFAVNMPGGVRLPPLGKPFGKDPHDGE
jgi:hypothetical protein